MNKPIYIAASPNTQFDDFILAKSLLLRPWTWSQKRRITSLEFRITRELGVNYAFGVDSARSGIYLSLKALGIGEGDEVILPSFTCLVVANAVRWTGATPIYLDSNKEDYNANYDDVAFKITERTKAIVVQHTFGKMVSIENLKSKIENRKLRIYIVEDFAHTIRRQGTGNRQKGKANDQGLMTNSFLQGDIGVLTFGIEKVISGVRGGAILVNDQEISSKIENLIINLPHYPRYQTFKALVNPIFWYIATPLHAVGIGKATIGAGLRWCFRKLGFLGNMIEQEEHKGDKPQWFPVQISPALATLVNHQLTKLEKMNAHRTKIAKLYDEAFCELSDYTEFDENRVWLRYPIRLKVQGVRDKIIKKAESKRIILGDWYQVPLYSKYVTDKTYAQNCYVPATTPITVEHCKHVINLPTGVNVSEKDARRIVELLNSVLDN